MRATVYAPKRLMSPSDGTDPWPRMSELVTAAVAGLRDGRFIEETLEALCVQLGASSAWSTLETRGGGPMHRSRTASFRGVPPAVLAQHVTETLQRVQADRVTVSGPVPYHETGSFIAVPLWSHPIPTKGDRRLIGAMYLEFPGNEGLTSAAIGFVESVGTLLGGLIAQQGQIEAAREDLRVERAKDHQEHYLELDELLAPTSMSDIRHEVHGAIAGRASIMILGESGTGKTQLATALARATNRQPIVRATLGLSDDLNTITSELFGHERGAFSGAVSKRKGLVEYAHKGTLILDEVLNLRAPAQQLLLDFTQFGVYRPLGYQGRDPKHADVRLISVTNGDMEKAIADKLFRQDLYYRLATVPLVLPPLRERRDDIPEIAVRYLNRTDAGKSWDLDEEAEDLLSSPRLAWTGNIRELESVMERARNRANAEASDAAVVQGRHLDLGRVSSLELQAVVPIAKGGPSSWQDDVRTRWESMTEQRETLDQLEREVIEDALTATGGVVQRAARALGVPRTGLVSRVSKLGIDTNRFKRRDV